MERTIIGSFTRRRDAEIAVEHLVQEHGVERADIFIQAQGEANSAGTGPDVESGHYGAENLPPAELKGAVVVSVDCHGEQTRVVEMVLRESGAEQLRSR